MTMTETAVSTESYLSDDELSALQAWWRAANYLSVGQIYLLDNPLLREPLRPEHVKPRLLGHWGTTPGLNFLYAHMNRAIRARDLNTIYVTGPGHGGPGLVASAYLDGHLQRGLPAHRTQRRGPAAAVPPVLVPRRDPQPRRARDARLDPRGRRARLLAGARLRRRVRQPRPGGAVRGRRRRGRDRAARDQLALEQVPESRARRRGAAGAAPERLQDRQPDGAGADHPRRAARAARGLRLRAPVRRGLRPGGDARADGGDARRGRSTRSPAIQERARRSGPARIRRRAPALADDRAAHARRDGPGRRRSTACPPRASFRSHQVPLGEVRTNPEHLALLEEWMRSYRPEELFDEHGAVLRARHGAGAGRRAADEREPARQRRPAAARPRAARLPRLRGRGPRAGQHQRARRRACSAAGCAT